MSGIDFNRQEFEVGYLQDDSTILEEIKNPYAGFVIQYNKNYSADRFLNMQDALRLDQQNYRNDLNFRWVPADWLNIRFGNYWNYARNADYYSYIENGLDIAGAGSLAPGLQWHAENDYRYRLFTGKSPGYADYYRNRMWLGLAGTGLRGDYSLELYENLGTEETDYRQHLLRCGTAGYIFPPLYATFTLEGTWRDYKLKLGDSLAVNRFVQAAGYLTADLELSEWFRLGLEENYLFKTYEHKSGFEPDYHLNYLKPVVIFRWDPEWEWTTGFEWEMKKHIPVPGDTYEVGEQDYSSLGIVFGTTFNSPSGAYVLLNLGLQWRRYPASVSKEIISLYTDRNIFDVMIIGNLPLSRHLNLNIFAVYDNDQDIDFDQQNNQSTIFTLELEYLF